MSKSLIKTCSAVLFVLLSIFFLCYTYQKEQPYVVNLQATSIRSATSQNILKITLGKTALMRIHGENAVDCYFPDFNTAILKSFPDGSFPEIGINLKNNESVRIQNQGEITIVKISANEKNCHYELKKNDSLLYVATENQQGIFSRKIFIILFICMISVLVAAFILPTEYLFFSGIAIFICALDIKILPDYSLKRGAMFFLVANICAFHFQKYGICFKNIFHDKRIHFYSLISTLLLLKTAVSNALIGIFPLQGLQFLCNFLLIYFLGYNFFSGLFLNLQESFNSNNCPQELSLGEKIQQFFACKKNIVIIFVLFTLYLLLHNPLFFSKYKFFCKYRLGHLLYSYELAFMPRAFIGNFVNFASKFISQTYLFQIAYYTSVLVSFALIFQAIQKIKSSRHILALTFLAILYFSLPVTYLHLINDFARLDFLLFLIGILSILLHWRNSKFKYFTMILTPIAVLIHEMYLAFYLPALLAVIFWKWQGETKFALRHFILNIVSACFSVIIFLSLKNNTPGYQAIIDFCQAKDNYQVCYFSNYALRIIEKDYAFHITNLIREIKMNFFNYLFGMLFLFGFAIYPFYIWHQLLQNHQGLLRIKILMLFLAALAPAGMAILIVDYARWQAAFCNCNFILLLLILSDKEIKLKLKEPGKKMLNFVGIATLVFLLSGNADCFNFSNLSRISGNACKKIFVTESRK